MTRGIAQRHDDRQENFFRDEQRCSNGRTKDQLVATAPPAPIIAPLAQRFTRLHKREEANKNQIRAAAAAEIPETAASTGTTMMLSSIKETLSILLMLIAVGHSARKQSTVFGLRRVTTSPATHILTGPEARLSAIVFSSTSALPMRKLG